MAFEKSTWMDSYFPREGDYGILHKYLRLPYPFMRVMFTNYTSLHTALLDLPQIVKTTNSLYQKGIRKHMEDQGKNLVETLKVQKMVAKGVPAYYAAKSFTISADYKTMSAVTAICNDPKKFCRTGSSLYLYSDSANSAMMAGMEICKHAISASVDTAIFAFPEFMSRVKDFNMSSDTFKRATTCEMLCFYMVGTEYLAASGFTEAALDQVIQKRALEGRPTVLISHLTPAAFFERYARGIESFRAVPLPFHDRNIRSTVESLIAELS